MRLQPFWEIGVLRDGEDGRLQRGAVRQVRGRGAAGDGEFGAALAADLPRGFERLVGVYQDRLYGFALRLTGNRQEAEDITQDAFVRAYQALKVYPSARRRALLVRPWLYRIALNVFRNRRRGRRPPVVSLDREGEGIGAEVADADVTRQPEAAFERMELHSALAALVSALPPRYRVPVVLRHVQGVAYGEIASILGKPIGTVKANVHRGLRRLEAGLARQLDIVPARPRVGAQRGG